MMEGSRVVEGTVGASADVAFEGVALEAAQSKSCFVRLSMLSENEVIGAEGEFIQRKRNVRLTSTTFNRQSLCISKAPVFRIKRHKYYNANDNDL